MSTDAARTAARILLEIGAVHIRPQEPFTYTSGRLGPVYVDCRKVIAFPRARSAIVDLATRRVLDAIGHESVDAVAGGETAGIPYAAWIADRLHLPMLYVRKKPKGFGRNAQIEGVFPEGARVLLVEDLATDGGSKRIFIDALRAAGAKVSDAVVVFFYSAPGIDAEPLKDVGVRLHALATWNDVLTVAAEEERLKPAEIDNVRTFLADPAAWSKANGGP